MTSIAKLDGPRAAPASGGQPNSLIILLHGVGADGHDLFSITPLLAEHFPKSAFVAPNAPFPCDMSPFGYQWFSLQDRSIMAIAAGVKSAAPILDSFIDAELQRHGVKDDRLVLIGFSQGTMMALNVALRRPRPCSCVLGFSGALVRDADLKEEITSKTPIFLAHGDSDEIVPIGALRDAAEALNDAGVTVETYEEADLGHSIGQRGLLLGIDFMLQHLKT